MVKVAFFEETLEIPPSVEVKVDNNNHVTVKGPNGGPITKDFSHARGIKIAINGNKIDFTTHFPKGSTLALIGTIINVIKNLMNGVLENYQYLLKVCYSHFPFSCELKKDKKTLHITNFLGEKAPRKSVILNNVGVDIKEEDVILTGPDKESLGQTMANIRFTTKIKKKDPRVFQDGIFLYKVIRGKDVIWQIK